MRTAGKWDETDDLERGNAKILPRQTVDEKCFFLAPDPLPARWGNEVYVKEKSGFSEIPTRLKPLSVEDPFLLPSSHSIELAPDSHDRFFDWPIRWVSVPRRAEQISVPLTSAIIYN